MRKFSKASEAIEDIGKKSIFEIRVSFKFHSDVFFSQVLSKLTSELKTLKPKRVKLQIFWSPSNLTLENRKALRSFMASLKGSPLEIHLPFCLPGWKDYEKIKRFASFPDCDSCIFKKGNRCPGLIPSSCPRVNLFEMKIKDFSDISLEDFKDKDKPLTWWIPRKIDIERIIRLSQLLHRGKGLPRILDVGCGQGFLAYLLTKTEKVKVIGIDPNETLIKETRFKHQNLTLLPEMADSFLSEHQGRFNLVISSFMPYQLDDTAKIKRRLRPKAIVYIEDRIPGGERYGYYLSLEISERKNRFQYAFSKESGCFSLGNYRPFMRWKVPSINELEKKELSSFASQIEIQLRKDIPKPSKLKVFPEEKYGWEKELEFLKGRGRITIGDVTFSVSSPKFIQVSNLYPPFLTSKRPDVKIKVHYGSLLHFRHKRKVFDSEGPWSLYQRDAKEVLYLCSNKRLEKIMVLQPHYKKVDLYLKSSRLQLEDILGYPLGEILMISLLSQEKGLLIHSCGINNNGEGMLFAGNSGAGKSTLASLGINKKEINVLSDDRVIVRNLNGRFRIYGTPWHGDAKVCSAEKAPLEKIFFLKHAKRNTAKKIAPMEAASRLIVCSFPTFWDKKGMEFTLKFCAELAQRIPCYELGFVPDESVLDFVRDV